MLDRVYVKVAKALCKSRRLRNVDAHVVKRSQCLCHLLGGEIKPIKAAGVAKVCMAKHLPIHWQHVFCQPIAQMRVTGRYVLQLLNVVLQLVCRCLLKAGASAFERAGQRHRPLVSGHAGTGMVSISECGMQPVHVTHRCESLHLMLRQVRGSVTQCFDGATVGNPRICTALLAKSQQPGYTTRETNESRRSLRCSTRGT
mmetsp:Transcript_87482/g.245625  ORF Transcript_87482/g.245625 Transcript_87482/m.245625 type:complete len:200 (-) Transcript_87482:155-754(-)